MSDVYDIKAVIGNGLFWPKMSNITRFHFSHLGDGLGSCWSRELILHEKTFCGWSPNSWNPRSGFNYEDSEVFICSERFDMKKLRLVNWFEGPCRNHPARISCRSDFIVPNSDPKSRIILSSNFYLGSVGFPGSSLRGKELACLLISNIDCASNFLPKGGLRGLQMSGIEDPAWIARIKYFVIFVDALVYRN